MFGMQTLDTEMVIVHHMPLLKKHGYDVFFAGHEHIMAYSHAPDSIFDESKTETEAIDIFNQLMNVWND